MRLNGVLTWFALTLPAVGPVALGIDASTQPKPPEDAEADADVTDGDDPLALEQEPDAPASEADETEPTEHAAGRYLEGTTAEVPADLAISRAPSADVSTMTSTTGVPAVGTTAAAMSEAEAAAAAARAEQHRERTIINLPSVGAAAMHAAKPAAAGQSAAADAATDKPTESKDKDSVPSKLSRHGASALPNAVPVLPQGMFPSLAHQDLDATPGQGRPLSDLAHAPGAIGRRTRMAVTEFQQLHGMPPQEEGEAETVDRLGLGLGER